MWARLQTAESQRLLEIRAVAVLVGLQSGSLDRGLDSGTPLPRTR